VRPQHVAVLRCFRAITYPRYNARAMAELSRTHTIAEIIAAPLGATALDGTPATLMGWVHFRRDLGQLIFITLRDRWATLQCVFDPELSEAAHSVAEGLRGEYVVAFTGYTRARPAKELRGYEGGDREFVVMQAAVLNAAEPPPFLVEEEVKASEEMRLKFRYIDLRRRSMVRALTVRHQAVTAIRDYLNGRDFLEIETPLLARSTPEGARDYVVPSRVHHGTFYALPQSPQLFKQILMVGGIDRYYQIAKCLRDEDLRGNRQPEHTQLDLEMSFASRDDLFGVLEGCMQAVWRACLGEELPVPFPRLNYDEAMRRYGSDKPDLRFGCEITELTPLFAHVPADFIHDGIAQGQQLHGVFIPGAALSRKLLDEWALEAKKQGASGLMSLELGGPEVKGSLAKYITDPQPCVEAAWSARVPAGEANGGQGRPPSKAGTWFIVLGAERRNLLALGQLRLKLAQTFGLYGSQAGTLAPPVGPDSVPVGVSSQWQFAWIVDFPLYEQDEATGAVTPAHHAFTSPLASDIPKLDSDDPEVLLTIRADNYDLVLNGVEMSSGSLRIFDPALQMQVLRKVGLSDEQIEARFGWFLAAYRYGAPPHRGVGFGIDRLIMSLLNVENIREVIAFPKTATAQDPLTGAPAEIDPAQWAELGLKPAKEHTGSQ